MPGMVCYAPVAMPNAPRIALRRKEARASQGTRSKWPRGHGALSPLRASEPGRGGPGEERGDGEGGKVADDDDGSTGRGRNPNDAIMGSGPSFELDGLTWTLILFGVIAFQFFVVAFL